MKNIFVGSIFGAILCVSAQATTIPTITLLPSQSGLTTGLGFSLTYTDPADYVVLTGSVFTGAHVYGTYNDYLSQPSAPLYVAGAADAFGDTPSINQPWNAASVLGLGEFDFFSTSPGGTVVTGNILVHYSVFSASPNNPNFDPGSATVVADATVSVPASFTLAPEPATWAMIGAGLALVLARRHPRSIWF